MVMNEDVKAYLADSYFAGRIPGNLVRYLYDRYGEDPVEGELSPQFFWPCVIDDVKAYLHGDLDIRLRTPLQKLQDRYDDLEGLTMSFARDISHLREEIAYLRDFIRYTHTGRLFGEFRENAHKEQDEMGFPFYTL